MRRIFLLGILGFGFVLSGCESQKEKQDRLNGIGFKYAQSVVKNELIDPSSAQFKNQNGFCGEVNSKNKMGGYVGFKRFITLAPKTVIFESEQNISTNQFPKAWDDVCSRPFEFKDEKLIEPNFKLPDAVYSKPKYTIEKGAITATPKNIVIKEGSYIYPELSVSCMNKKTRFILLSYRSPAYDNDGMISLTDEKIKKLTKVPFNGVEGIQEFYSNGDVDRLLANANELTIYFKASDDGISMQTYNMVEFRRLMKEQNNNCNWAML